MRDRFLEALNFRHACKKFDESRVISEDDFEYILESGRLSPSSFGMEQWRFLIVESQNIKEKLRPLCWDQAQITTCSKLLVIKAQKRVVDGVSEYVEKMFDRRELKPDLRAAYLARYRSFIEDRKGYESVASWSGRQCYIAAANMMSGAALIGIDSCAIEGFEREGVERVLNIDTKIEDVGLIVAFGYRIKEPPQKIRLPLSELVERI